MQLDRAFENLITALAPAGKLRVLEDLFLNDSTDHHAKRLCKDWHLKKAYTLAD